MMQTMQNGPCPRHQIVNDLTLNEAALHWFKFGLQVIPVIPGTKKPAVKWDPWLSDLDIDKIKDHWNRHPNHEIAAIVGGNMVVFDMDTKEADVAMLRLMQQHGLSPLVVVRTTKGSHHYYAVPEGVSIKGDSHSTTDHPERIDVKTGRGAVMLPPSMGKKLLLLQADHADELTQIDQEFVNAVFAHNGRPLPGASNTTPRKVRADGGSTTALSSLKRLLDQIDPDCGYADWLHAIMAVFHETGGSEEGFDLVDAWSSKGDKYKGAYDVEATWTSLETGHGNPITIATLYSLAIDNVEPFERCETVVIECQPKAKIEAFERCETVVIDPRPQSVRNASNASNPFKVFSLKGHQEEILSRNSDQAFCLEGLAIMGQLSVIYAPPNTGKTLLVLKLLSNAISANKINGDNVFYLDCDDNVQGLSEKNAIAEEFGFHLLADGWQGFSISEFYDEFWGLIKSPEAHHTVLILDTLKKFVDPMNKSESRRFSRLLRRFVQVGGTVVTLAHTNKNRTQSGALIPAGTSDIQDDFDAAYVLDACTTTSNSTEKVVTFTNIKKRGNNVNEVSYEYTTDQDITYRQLFDSVHVVNDEAVAGARIQGQLEADAVIINAIKAAIADGVNGKMQLVEAVNKRTNESNRKIADCLERYTGADAAKKLWKTTRGDRGKMTFELIEG